MAEALVRTNDSETHFRALFEGRPEKLRDKAEQHSGEACWLADVVYPLTLYKDGVPVCVDFIEIFGPIVTKSDRDIIAIKYLLVCQHACKPGYGIRSLIRKA